MHSGSCREGKNGIIIKDQKTNREDCSSLLVFLIYYGIDQKEPNGLLK